MIDIGVRYAYVYNQKPSRGMIIFLHRYNDYPAPLSGCGTDRETLV